MHVDFLPLAYVAVVWQLEVFSKAKYNKCTDKAFHGSRIFADFISFGAWLIRDFDFESVYLLVPFCSCTFMKGFRNSGRVTHGSRGHNSGYKDIGMDSIFAGPEIAIACIYLWL